MAHLTTMVPRRAGLLRRRVKRTQQKGVKAYRKQWYELKNCMLSWWKDEPTEGQPPIGDIRMDQLRSVSVDGLHFSLFTGDVVRPRASRVVMHRLTLCALQTYDLLAPSQEDFDAWIAAIDQSTMRGIIQSDTFESTATNEAAREAFTSPHVSTWDEQTEAQRNATADSIFEGLLDPLGEGDVLNEDNLETKLGESFDYVEKFCDILDDVAKCYPRREDAHEWLTAAFHKNVAARLGAFAAVANIMWTPGAALIAVLVFRWLPGVKRWCYLEPGDDTYTHVMAV